MYMSIHMYMPLHGTIGLHLQGVSEESKLKQKVTDTGSCCLQIACLSMSLISQTVLIPHV